MDTLGRLITRRSILPLLSSILQQKLRGSLLHCVPVRQAPYTALEPGGHSTSATTMRDAPNRVVAS